MKFVSGTWPKTQPVSTAIVQLMAIIAESQQFPSSLHVHARRCDLDHLALVDAKPERVRRFKHVNVLTNH
jgi:hypothetical protein